MNTVRVFVMGLFLAASANRVATAQSGEAAIERRLRSVLRVPENVTIVMSRNYSQRLPNATVFSARLPSSIHEDMPPNAVIAGLRDTVTLVSVSQLAVVLDRMGVDSSSTENEVALAMKELLTLSRFAEPCARVLYRLGDISDALVRERIPRRTSLGPTRVQTPAIEHRFELYVSGAVIRYRVIWSRRQIIVDTLAQGPTRLP